MHGTWCMQTFFGIIAPPFYQIVYCIGTMNNAAAVTSPIPHHQNLENQKKKKKIHREQWNDLVYMAYGGNSITVAIIFWHFKKTTYYKTFVANLYHGQCVIFILPLLLTFKLRNRFLGSFYVFVPLNGKTKLNTQRIQFISMVVQW